MLDYLRHFVLGSSDGLCWIFVILQFTREIGLVGGHVEVTVAGEVEEDHALLACFFGFEGFVDHGTDGVSGLWGP